MPSEADFRRHRTFQIRFKASDAAQQFVHAGFRTGLRVHAFDDDGAVKAVAAVFGRHTAGHDDRTCRYAALVDFAGGAVEDFGGLTDEHAHRNHAAFFDNHALNDFRTRTDEAVVFNDGGGGLQGSSTPPIPTPPLKCTFLPICAQEPTVAQVSTIAPSSTYAPMLT